MCLRERGDRLGFGGGFDPGADGLVRVSGLLDVIGQLRGRRGPALGGPLRPRTQGRGIRGVVLPAFTGEQFAVEGFPHERVPEAHAGRGWDQQVSIDQLVQLLANLGHRRARHVGEQRISHLGDGERRDTEQPPGRCRHHAGAYEQQVSERGRQVPPVKARCHQLLDEVGVALATGVDAIHHLR